MLLAIQASSWAQGHSKLARIWPANDSYYSRGKSTDKYDAHIMSVSVTLAGFTDKPLPAITREMLIQRFYGVLTREAAERLILEAHFVIVVVTSGFRKQLNSMDAITFIEHFMHDWLKVRR